MQPADSTIFALATAPARAAIAVLRVSGPAAGAVLDRLASPRPAPRRAVVRDLREPLRGSLLDRALVLWLPGPGTYTGEDQCELHLHGGPAVVRAVVDVLARMPGLRPAEPGELTRRAFLNGRLDLTEAEGIADLIDAETEGQRRQAARQATGHLRARLEAWRQELIDCMALVEADLDFSDEADVGPGAAADVAPRIAELRRVIAAALDDRGAGEIVRDGLRVVLAGAVNAGKSSLLNALARRDVAIVSPEPGTTRDVIEVRLDLAGFPVLVSDTAGLRPTSGVVEMEGIRRTRARLADAEIVLWVLDCADPALPPRDLALDPAARLIVVANKSDLAAPPRLPGLSDPPLAVSAVTGQGLDGLLAILAEAVQARIGRAEAPVITRARHRTDLAGALAALDAFLAGGSADAELRAEDLRAAAHRLGRIVGTVDVEDILDRVFASFCIGK